LLRFWFKFRFKKLVISSKVIEEIEIISLCKLDEILSKENYFEKSFLIDAHLISQKRSFNLCSLIDSDSVVYMIIHFNLVNKVCEKLKIQSISLTKKKLIRDYDEKIFKKTITHKIELTSDSTLSRCWAYQMFSVKLLKVKKYLNENLSKKFITLSQTLYFSSILFILKANKDLQFCVNYQKLNVIFKRNRYSLLLINEIIDKIMSCKHLTRLNIISVFNKLQMHFDNENYITFITALKAYKYKMLSFKLTNELIFFQQYMNDVLWDFLNDFCQVYLDDILIYSKMRKKHRDHVKLVLRWLREAELQMNIQKCKFDVEETVFLEVIVSELDLHMNFSKVTVIVSWITSINLKKIQSFVKFVNFYRRFIKNFLKLVKSFT